MVSTSSAAHYGALARRNYKQVCTTIPVKLWQEARSNGLTFQSLIIDGMNARKGLAPLLERQREQERKIEKLAVELDVAQRQLWQFKNQGAQK